MKRAPLFSIAGLALLLTIGCSEPAATGESQQAAARPPTAVSVTTLSLKPVVFKTSLPGRVSAFQQSQVRPQVDGVITQRLFEEGAQVKQGQQLYQIDDVRYKARLNSARADLNSAEANFKTTQAKEARYRDLMKRSAVSEQEYDDAVAQLSQAKAAISVAQAAIEVAQVNLDYTKVYAPISGQISRSYVTVGALVTANQAQELATITQLDPVYVDMQISGKYILDIRKAMRNQPTLPVELTLDEAGDERYEQTGELKFSEVTVDETTGAVTLRALLPNPDGLLMPGMFVKAHVITETQQALLVPQRATMRQPDGSLMVYVVNDKDQVEPRVLTASRSYQDQYIVTSGVASGERVIVVGYQKVRPGATVSPEPWQDNSIATRG
ncbi:efflux RND transporter periplasmic adaptor subunit [Alteromonas aestuariivivens]|uniref:Efflux RND transporter periplasmic adaptor subunit n=1 Tax=Alteromonas aestuariivivens TaxID=1938339 RepID=A0A3D8M7D7_9ALTE|nr:efflux RND transporter periplasmic adaptor subunit [Alteromonas aestuariivivens]RDV25499.1 efflux RND transporter periplasmic adaptor subunit [Alteromonas aestuariivivens]